MSALGISVPSDHIQLFEPGIGKHEALEHLVEVMSRDEAIVDIQAFRDALYERERVQSTGIGGGVAIPHVRIAQVRAPVLGVGISQEGLDFNALDQQPVHVVVLFAMPAGSQRDYLNLLAQVMVTLKTPGLRDELMACGSPEEVSRALENPHAGRQDGG